MTNCVLLTRAMLQHPIDLSLDPEGLNFSAAKAAADRQARELCPEPMLLAWFEKSTGRYSPRVECCREDQPAWLTYAKTRGGDLVIDINAEEYVFVYRRV
jgi:hypothetical protein